MQLAVWMAKNQRDVAWVANRCAVTTHTVRNWLNGHFQPNAVNRRRISRMTKGEVQPGVFRTPSQRRKEKESHYA